MAGKVILAVAGAGKTFYICNAVDPARKNLLLAFTRENVKNLNRELIRRFGYIPEKTFVMTYHSFLHQFLIRPYEQTIFKTFSVTYRETNGVTLKSPPESSITTKSGGYIKNPQYFKVGSIHHYMNSNCEYYCTLMASLLMNLPARCLKQILQNFSRFFDDIYILMNFKIFDRKNMSCFSTYVRFVSGLLWLGIIINILFQGKIILENRMEHEQILLITRLL